MTNLAQLSSIAVSQQLQEDYDAFRAKGLKLDLTRGKPAADQLGLSDALLSLPGGHDYVAEGGVDCRNYGGLQGLLEVRRLFAGMMGAAPEHIVAANI